MKLAAVAAALVAFAVAGSAHAFCRSVACTPTPNHPCSSDDNPCPTGGPPLFWNSSCLTFSVQRDGSPLNGIDAQEFETTIERAFETWMKADCGDGTHPSINVSSLGEIECHSAQYSSVQGNANIYMFHDHEWTKKDPAAFAITTVWYDDKTGEIYDVDVEVNGTHGDITNTAPEDGPDLLSIITHESGHFLGLAHSDYATTMRPHYQPVTDNLRNLTQDDIDGICAVFPPDRQAVTDDCGPRHGFSSSCHTEDDDSGCDCAVTPGRPTSSAAWLLLGVAGLGALSRRRRRPAS